MFRRVVSRREVVFVVEDNHGGCAHACSVDDICNLLANIPTFDWQGLTIFVLRQPTEKQRNFRPAWGRLFYEADLGSLSGEAILRGPAIMLEAIDFETKLVWPKSLDSFDRVELDRLREDGHQIVRDGRSHVLSVSSESVRTTQLYRTFFHEIGHWVDFCEKVKKPTDDGRDFVERSKAYFSRPIGEREAFAHRYAEDTRARLHRFGIIPFAPL